MLTDRNDLTFPEFFASRHAGHMVLQSEDGSFMVWPRQPSQDDVYFHLRPWEEGPLVWGAQDRWTVIANRDARVYEPEDYVLRGGSWVTM